MKKTALFALLALTAPLFGQSAKDLFAKHWAKSKEFTLAVAEAMPAEQYSFRPNEVEMSFGQLMAHIATSNNGAFATVSGEKAPVAPEKIVAGRKDPAAIDKATAIKYLTESFDFCLKLMSSLPESTLSAEQGPEGRKMMGYERIWSYFTHTAHHRGQAEVYLRVKGIKPPAYTF
jgi:uncharacterized damage-inducible protein DinB